VFLFFYIFFLKNFNTYFIMIGVWGSQKIKILPRTIFLIYFIGSFFMLTGILLLTLEVGTTNIFIIRSITLEPWFERLIFFLFFLSFSVKVPIFPFHIWLPKAHVEAPTAGSVLLAGIY